MKNDKTTALFILSMPKNNAWNGRWTGENELYAYSKVVYRRGKALYPNLKEGSFLYDFEDGWLAKVEVKFVTPKDAKQTMKKSVGFSTYTWMCDELCKFGKILTRKERRQNNG